MALQVKIELGGVNYICIHDRASRAVPTSICDVGCWEEPYVVPFSDDNNSDLGVYVSRSAGLWLILYERMIHVRRKRQTNL